MELRKSLDFTMIFFAFVATAIVALIELFFRGLTIVSVGYGVVVPTLISIPLILFFVNLNLQKTGSKTIKKIYYYCLLLILINAPGSLILHKMGIQYDRFLHFGVAFLVVPLTMLLYSLLMQALGSGAINFKRVLKGTFFVVLAGLFLWEGYQYIIDQFFGTTLFFDVVQNIEVDFWEDIFFGFLGLITGYLYYLISPKRLEDILRIN